MSMSMSMPSCRVCACCVGTGYERVHPNVGGSNVSVPTPLPAADGEPAYVRPRAPVHIMVGHGGAAQVGAWP